MQQTVKCAGLALFLAAANVGAEILDADVGGFTVEHDVLVDAERAAVWNAATEQIDLWWNDDHTVSGDARRLHIDATPMGCFCERLQGDDGIVHMVVTSVSTNVLLRLTGGLGPLGLMGVSGNMTWEFFDADDGTRVNFVYAVGGYSSKGLDTMAAPVDSVIGDALNRLKSHVEDAAASTESVD